MIVVSETGGKIMKMAINMPRKNSIW